jgi:hypothetical protein
MITMAGVALKDFFSARVRTSYQLRSMSKVYHSDLCLDRLATITYLSHF